MEGTEKKNMSVARNQPCKLASLHIKERHNERLNESYMNSDVIKERSSLNIHFKKPAQGYVKDFELMAQSGVVSLKGLSKDPAKPPNLVDELLLDVNTGYFEDNGGYEFAAKFYAEAYEFVKGVVGGEQYILSAVMHADERNKAESERLGRDAFHYHLHVVYVPVVMKEERYSKRNKDKSLAGAVRRVFAQVSHSKKWPIRDRNGENSYSLLQDGFHDHMKKAGFKDFERGERKSTAKHLSMMDYKLVQDKKRSEAIGAEISNGEARLSEQKAELAKLGSDIKTKTAAVTILGLKLADTDASAKAEEARLSGLLSEIRNCESRLESLIQSARAMDAAIERGRDSLSKMDRSVSEKVAEIASEAVALESVREEIRQGRELLESVRESESEEKGRLGEVLARLDEARRELLGIEAKIGEKARALDEFEITRAKVELGERQLLSLIDELGKARSGLKETLRKVVEAKEELRLANAEKARVAELVERMRNSCWSDAEKAKGELADIWAKVEKATKELSNMSQEISVRRGMLEALDRSVANGRGFLAELEAKVDKVKEMGQMQVNERNGRLVDISRQVAEKEWSLGALMRDADAKESELIRLGQEIEKRMRTLKKLSDIQDEFDFNGKVPVAFRRVVLDEGHWSKVCRLAMRARLLEVENESLRKRGLALQDELSRFSSWDLSLDEEMALGRLIDAIRAAPAKVDEFLGSLQTRDRSATGEHGLEWQTKRTQDELVASH
jgi:hypothetical protein